MTLVVDASVAAKWYVAEPDSRLALAVGARGGLIAPDLILAEVANILWKAERQGRIAARDADLAAERLPSWFERLVPLPGLTLQALRIARALGHPAYDCFYLALAEREGVPLLSADRRLAAAVRGTTWAGAVRDVASFATGP